MLSVLSPQEWDSAVTSHPQYSFLQSYGWGEFQKKCGRNVERYCEKGSNGLFNIAQIISHRLPFSAWYGYCPRGPLASQEDSSGFQGFLSTELRKKGALFVRVEPPSTAPVGPGIFHTAAIQPPDVWVVDISRPEDSFLSSMHPKTRYNYRVSQKKGVTVQMNASLQDSNFQQLVEFFIELLSSTAGRHQFRLHSRKYYREMITFFMQGSNNASSDISLRLYTAFHEKTAIAAILVLYFGKTATFVHGGSRYEFRELMAPYALHIQAMKDASALGLADYDMGGIAHSDDPHDPWQGITRFKKGFSGYSLHYPGTFDIVFNSFFYTVYTKFRQTRLRLRSSMDRTWVSGT